MEILFSVSEPLHLKIMNKVHLPVVCQWSDLLGAWWVLVADVMGQMNSSVCQMFIAGKQPKQTQPPGADISICVGKENEEERV